MPRGHRPQSRGGLRRGGRLPRRAHAADAAWASCTASVPARACSPPARRFASPSAPACSDASSTGWGCRWTSCPRPAASRARRSPRLRARSPGRASQSASGWACARSTALVPCGRGQRLGIFAGSGVGKSSLMGMIARSTSAQVNVIALVGERGREVREFIERDLGDALERSVVVVATSDQPALVRIKAAFTATTIAEHFRDQGHDVMLDDGLGHALCDGPARGGPGDRRAARHARLHAQRVRAAPAPAGARRHQHQRFDHRAVHGAGRRRRHERADRRRGARDPRRARRAHPLARARRALPGDRRARRASRAWSARSSRPRSPWPASGCAPRWRCCARRKTSSRSAPTSRAATRRLTPRSRIAPQIEDFLRQPRGRAQRRPTEPTRGCSSWRPRSPASPAFSHEDIPDAEEVYRRADRPRRWHRRRTSRPRCRRYRRSG